MIGTTILLYGHACTIHTQSGHLVFNNALASFLLDSACTRSASSGYSISLASRSLVYINSNLQLLTLALQRIHICGIVGAACSGCCLHRRGTAFTRSSVRREHFVARGNARARPTWTKRSQLVTLKKKRGGHGSGPAPHAPLRAPTAGPHHHIPHDRHSRPLRCCSSSSLRAQRLLYARQ